MLRILFVLLAAVALQAQSFEVVSIRPSPPYPAQGGVNTNLQGGPGTADPTHIRRDFASIGNLINAAFGVRAYQVTAPSFVNSEFFHIRATVPKGATKDQLREMFRHLLEERFGMVARVEKAEFDGQELILDRDGPKLKPTELVDFSESEIQSAMQRVLAGGQLQSAGMVELSHVEPGAQVMTSRLMARAQTLSALADRVSSELEQPVIEATGLKGRYDFEFDYVPLRSSTRAAARGVTDTGINLVSAIQEHLGLRLRKTKAPLDHVIIEKINREPTEN